MKFSVIIPTYNRAHLLPRAIDSVLAQSFRDFELIIVDDASRDDTSAVVEKYDDSRINYLIHDHNRGQSVANNTGIAAARGELVSFLDSDDEWVSTYLEEVWYAFEQNPEVSFVYCRYVGGPHWTLSGADKYPEVLKQGFLSATITLSAKKAALMEVGGFNAHYGACNDDDLCFRLAQKHSFYHLPRELAIIHPTPNSMVRNQVAAAEGWRQLFQDYKLDILHECGHGTYARHCFTVAELMFRLGCFAQGLSVSWDGFLSVLRERTRRSADERREVWDWSIKLARAATIGVRKLLL